MISACKGGSADKITGKPYRPQSAGAALTLASAVLPYFPYSRQSKKKAHRGAITARMLANLLNVAGVDHVITVDLHASQMQGFFKCPVDNLHAEPIIARWIRHNVLGWREAVVVSKNAGGTKRVTSLADALKLDFGMITTDRRRGGNMTSSMIFTQLDRNPRLEDLGKGAEDLSVDAPFSLNANAANVVKEQVTNDSPKSKPSPSRHEPRHESANLNRRGADRPSHIRTPSGGLTNSPIQRSPLTRSVTTPALASPIAEEDELEHTDERAREVVHGRLVQGHVVPDDWPSPTQSAVSVPDHLLLEDDPLAMSRASSFFAPESHALGGSRDAAASSDEEEGNDDPNLEQMITLVGNVRDRTVFIVDDMIDKAGSWIAAAETVVKRGGARKVYCIATHGLFGGESLEELQACDCIDTIVVTNSFPIPPEKAKMAKKLVVLDLSTLLAEAIRRNHYGESISVLFQHITE